jgi:hypothetical protein
MTATTAKESLATAPTPGRTSLADDDWHASSIYTQDDPLALRPPAEETAWEREARLALEADARRVSDEIDAGLRKEKAKKKSARKTEVKVRVRSWSQCLACGGEARLNTIAVCSCFSLARLVRIHIFFTILGNDER